MENNTSQETAQILLSRRYFLSELYDGIMATKGVSDALRDPLELKFYDDLYEQLHKAHIYVDTKPADGIKSWDQVLESLMNRVDTVVANMPQEKK